MSKFSGGGGSRRAPPPPPPPQVVKQQSKAAPSEVKRRQSKKGSTGAKGNIKVSSSGVFATGQQGIGESTSKVKTLLGG